MGSALAPLMLNNTYGAAPVKVLLDTDIGSDIDDAVALSYLLVQKRCQLLGITTVSGKSTQRAMLASALSHAAAKEIPIYPGAENPLIIQQTQPDAPQSKKLSMWPHKKNFEQGKAIAFMRKTIRDNPGEVTLLAVGPFTNIALLFMVDPEIPKLLKELVIMGGKYSDYPTPWGPTEWNAIVDPHATDIVLRQPDLKIRAFGLDITWRVSMTPKEVAHKFEQNTLLRIVHDWSKVWFEERELLHFHDPLAAVAIFNPEVCQYTKGNVQVELDDEKLLGVTHFEPSKNGHIRVATGIDSTMFFNKYFKPFGINA